MRGSASGSTYSRGSIRKVVYCSSASTRFAGMRWSTSQSPDSYMSRVNQKSYFAASCARSGGSERAAAAPAINRRKLRRSDRIRQRGEGEVAHLHRRDRHQERRLVRRQAFRLAELL